MTSDHKINIEPPNNRGERGQHYRVMYKGAILIKDTRNPEYDACRVLLAMGITGKLEAWRKNRQAPCLRLDIESGANVTVEEGQRVGPRLRRWVAHPDAAKLEAISCSRGLPQRPETLMRVDVLPISSSRAGGQTARAAET
jgi:hypothetical protein